jgi:hypothetical protein
MENHENNPDNNIAIDRNKVIKARYPSLNTIITINSVLRFIISPIVLLSGLILFLEGESVFWGLAFIIGGPVVFILITAINESIKVVLDIEYNTRYIARKP